MTEYGRIHTDGSRSGGQPLIKTEAMDNLIAQDADLIDAQPTQSDVERVARALAQADGIEICSDAIYALSSYGHKAQAALAALRQPTQSDVLKAAGDAIRGLLDITSDYNLDSEQAGRAYAALHDIGTALKGQSK